MDICFYFLAIMSNAAMNIHVYVLYGHVFSFLLGFYLREIVKLCLIFWGTARFVRYS